MYMNCKENQYNKLMFWYDTLVMLHKQNPAVPDATGKNKTKRSSYLENCCLDTKQKNH